MNATEFVKLVERRLGWEAPPGPSYQVYRAEAAKVKRKIASNPDLYTWENLRLAVELLARERQPRTPIGVFSHVERAVDLAVEKDEDVELEIWKVISYETQRGDPQDWGTRFARATGGYRKILLDEWRGSVK